jgi:hypothetical protein
MSYGAGRLVHASVWSPYAGRACSGLLPIYLSFAGEATDLPVTLTFRLQCETAGLDYAKRLELGAETRLLCFSLSSHLIENGEHLVRCMLVDDANSTIWSGSIAFVVTNVGILAEKVRSSLRGQGTPLVVEGGESDSSQFDFADASLQPWFDRPDAQQHIDRVVTANRLAPHEKQMLEDFVRDGYAIVSNTIEESLLTQIDHDIDDAVRRKVEGYEYGTSQRLHNLHQTYPSIAALWRHPAVMRYLELIFEAQPLPCQTLTYVFGSQQDPHQDTVHLTPFPAGYMCGVWVALEDVRENSGELIVYRGSHRLPRVYMGQVDCAKVSGTDWSEFDSKVVGRWKQLLRDGQFEKVTYRPKRGTVLIWHENLMHGGSVRLDTSLSRRSIVSHVFASGAVAFYDSSGMPGHMELPDSHDSTVNASA